MPKPLEYLRKLQKKLRKEFEKVRDVEYDLWLQRSERCNQERNKTEYESCEAVWVVRPEIWHVYSKPQTFEARFKAKETG